MTLALRIVLSTANKIIVYGLILEGANSQRHAESLADFAALLDFFFGHDFFNDGQDDVWHMELGEGCKFLERIKRLEAKSRSREGEKFFGGWRVQRNRNGVEAAFKLRGDLKLQTIR